MTVAEYIRQNLNPILDYYTCETAVMERRSISGTYFIWITPGSLFESEGFCNALIEFEDNFHQAFAEEEICITSFDSPIQPENPEMLFVYEFSGTNMNAQSAVSWDWVPGKIPLVMPEHIGMEEKAAVNVFGLNNSNFFNPA